MTTKLLSSQSQYHELLGNFAKDFASALKAADARKPVAISARTKKKYKPGIGPHTEDNTVELAVQEIKRMASLRYSATKRSVSYGQGSGKKCDLLLSTSKVSVFIEVKLFRLMYDNGKQNHNVFKHIFSPYPQHRSAFTDCAKLRSLSRDGIRAIMVIAYDAENYPTDTTIEAFECLANVHGDAKLGPRHKANFADLVHPVHKSGSVNIWQLI